MSDDQKKPILSIDRETLVPLGLLLAVVVSAIGATTWIQGTLLGLKGQIELLSEKVMTIQQHEVWSIDNHDTFAELLQARNPTIGVPLRRKKP